MKVLKNYTMPALITILMIGFSSFSIAQQKKKVEKSVKVEMSSENDKTNIKIKIKKEDGTYFEKSYSSKEEMENDPELKDLNLEFGEPGNIFIHEDGHEGNFEIMVDEDGNKSSNVMVFKSKQSSEKDSGGEHMFFNSTEGSTYNITKDDNGRYLIEKDGKPIDIEKLESENNALIEVEEDGTMVIKDGNKTTEIKMDGSGGGNAFFITDDDVVHELDGNKKVIHLKGEDGEENVWIEEGGDGEHEMILINSNGDIDKELIEKLKTENGEIIIKIDSDEDGNHEVHIEELTKIHIEILDLKSVSEISEIPNVHLNSEGNLDLEEVNYYPNPNSGEFTLRFQAEVNPTQIKIVDMMGKEVYNEQIKDFRGTYDKNINLSDSEPGLYILQVIQNDKSWSKKVVVE